MDQVTSARITLRNIHQSFAGAAFVGGVAACASMKFGNWLAATIFYFLATAARLAAGAAMNRMGDAETVNAWNNRCHRFVVIALNSVVGVVLLGRLMYDWFARGAHGEELAFFVTVIALYFVIAKFTRPNTRGARVRSAFLTVAIAMVMAWVSWPQHISWITIAAVLAFCGAGYRIDQLQRRFGWADR